MSQYINPDFSEEIKPLGPGKYSVRVMEYSLQTGKQFGTKFINWKLETLGASGGVTIFHSTPIEGKGAGFFKRFVQATINPLYDGGQVDLEKIIGKTLVVDTFKDDRGYLKVREVEPDAESFDANEDVPSEWPTTTTKRAQ